MCAKKATPEPLDPTRAGKTFWKINQKGRYHFADMCNILMKNPKNIIVMCSYHPVDKIHRQDDLGGINGKIYFPKQK
ncbi:MAG: hypothetical protein WEC35_02440 [Nitrosopumilaceae archaeon]